MSQQNATNFSKISANFQVKLCNIHNFKVRMALSPIFPFWKTVKDYIYFLKLNKKSHHKLNKKVTTS